MEERKEFLKNYYSQVKPKKFCVFCGKQPHSKTKEHIIPKWLIEFTGDLNRPISIGPLISQFAIHDNETEFFKNFSFNGLVFPACEKCNQQFGELEAQLKPILTNLITYQQLSSFDINLLLDWFDKIRIGLWLGFNQYYDENYWGILPHFFISDRLGKADRALLIYKADGEYNGIRFVGVLTPAFAHSPTCFTLILNNLFIINVSYASLFAKYAGFPYFEHMEYTEDEKIKGFIEKGTNEIKFPIWRLDSLPKGNIIAQIIYLVSNEHELFPEYYENDYVRINTLTPTKSFPVLQRGNSVSFYPSTSSDLWIPIRSHNLDKLIIDNSIQTLKIQNSMFRRASLSRSMSKELRNYFRKEFSNCIKSNNQLINILQESE